MKPWKLLKTTPLMSVQPWFQISQEEVELPSGRILNDFYRIVMPEFSMVVPVTTSGELLMVRGYRHGPRKICLSVPGGLIEQGESPLEAARRELLEETGYQAAEWLTLGKFTVDSNRQGGTAHLFLATNIAQVEHAVHADSEDLHLELMRPERVLESIRDQEIATLGTLSAITLAMVHGLE